MKIETYERIKSIIDEAMKKLSNLDGEYDEDYFDIDTQIEYYERIDHIKAEAFDKIIGLG